MNGLLTPAEIADEHEEALNAWKCTSKEIPWEDYWNVWLFLAQVKKVVVWPEISDCTRTLQALREAAGGEG